MNEKFVHVERVLFLQFPVTCTYVNILFMVNFSPYLEHSFSLDVTLLYYYFDDHKVVLILLRDLFLKVLSQI